MRVTMSQIFSEIIKTFDVSKINDLKNLAGSAQTFRVLIPDFANRFNDLKNATREFEIFHLAVRHVNFFDLYEEFMWLKESGIKFQLTF